MDRLRFGESREFEATPGSGNSAESKPAVGPIQPPIH
jgi:hypothetical protein